MPTAVQDQTNPVDVRERDPATRSPELSGEGDRVAAALLAVDSDKSVLKHASPRGSRHDRTRAGSRCHPGIAAPAACFVPTPSRIDRPRHSSESEGAKDGNPDADATRPAC